MPGTPNPLPGIPLTESPFFDRLIGSAGLAPEQQQVARDLHRDGLAVIDFDDAGFEERARDIIDALCGRYDDQDRLIDAYTMCPSVKALAVNEPVLELLGAVYQRRAIPFQTLNFARGTEQALHSDSVHFNSVPERFMCGVWVALEDTDESNGPLLYYPGSHRLPVYDNASLGVSTRGAQGPYDSYDKYVESWQALVDELAIKPRTVHLRRGQAVIWAANLLHGGAPQLDRARSRYSQVTHYFFADCIYYTPLLSDVCDGRIFFRKVHNIATGEVEPNCYAGEPVSREFIRTAVQRTPLGAEAVRDFE